jgi:SAM-dependent methyltransferase
VDERDGILRATHATWGSEGYDWLGHTIRGMGGRLVARLGVGPDDEVLDVGCGTGNVALQAAAAGAAVTGLDIVPAMLARARLEADRRGVTVDWVDGDAEALPFPAAAFDVAASSFGCMLAPRHHVAAAEIARVLRPGGRLGILAWAVDGDVSALLGLIGAHLPPPPPLAAPPALWGDEGHVRAVFDGRGIELRIERDRVDFRFASADVATAECTTRFGPLMAARSVLEPQGRWDDLVLDVAAFFARHAGGNGVVLDGEHLVVTGRATG